jgi:glycosyltransferase involved in cell wall biosynthesis
VQKDIRRRVAFVPTPFFLETTELNTAVFERFLRGKTYFLFFGSLSKLKGVGLILEILAELLQSNPGLSFVFVGKDLGAASAVKAMQQSSTGRVLYFDRLPHSQLYPIIREAFAVVLPSLYDNCPNACLEAMAFGRAVIGSENAGFEELIDHERTGFLFRWGSSADLLRMLNKVLRLPQHIRAALGEAAFKRVWELRPQRAIPKLITLYEDVLNSRRAA